MYQLSNFIDNDDIRTLAQLGPFQVIEYQRDLSVSPDSAQTAYFSSVMHVRRRQVLCDLKQANITLQAGAMQRSWLWPRWAAPAPLSISTSPFLPAWLWEPMWSSPA